jgi:thioredoxin reductase
MRKVRVVDSGRPRNSPAGSVHGYLGLDGVPPAHLSQAGRAEAQLYGAGWSTGVAVSAHKMADGTFAIRDDTGEVHRARAVVATGLRDDLPDIDGVREMWGQGVAHCPYCHGYEVRGGRIGVIGGGNRGFTLHQAELLRLWSSDVEFFPHTVELTHAERERLTRWGVTVTDGRVKKLEHVGHDIAVQIEDDRVAARSAVFVGPQFVPNDALLRELGCRPTSEGWIDVDGAGATSVGGVWSAGNVTDSPAQLIHAAAQGTRTGIAVNRALLEHDVLERSTRR